MGTPEQTQPAGRASPPPRPTGARRLPTAERRTCSFARRTCAALPDADCGRNCESPHDVHGFRGSGARRRGKRPPPKSNCNTSGMERKSARVYAAEPPHLEADCAALRGAFFSSASLRAAQRGGRRSIQPSIRALLPPMRRDGFGALSRPTARQADSARAAIYKRIRRTAILESLCFARSPRRKRNASSPRAITTGPTCNKNVYGDGSGRTAASLRQTSRPARGAGCAIFQRTGPRRFGAPTFDKSTKTLALHGFWYGAGSAAPMGRLSRRKAVLQHKRNSQRPKKEIGGSQRRDSAAILETEILCR